jgi:hypothetical protein
MPIRPRVRWQKSLFCDGHHGVGVKREIIYRKNEKT